VSRPVWCLILPLRGWRSSVSYQYSSGENDTKYRYFNELRDLINFWGEIAASFGVMPALLYKGTNGVGRYPSADISPCVLRQRRQRAAPAGSMSLGVCRHAPINLERALQHEAHEETRRKCEMRRYWYHRTGEGRDFHISMQSFAAFVSSQQTSAIPLNRKPPLPWGRGGL
jgi:ribosomal protein L20